jgi:serine/threonine protein kinase
VFTAPQAALIQEASLLRRFKHRHVLLLHTSCWYNKCRSLLPVCLQAALIREASLLRRFQHRHVLLLHTSFVVGRELWMVMPFMDLGSVRSIMRKAFPQVCWLPTSVISLYHAMTLTLCCHDSMMPTLGKPSGVALWTKRRCRCLLHAACPKPCVWPLL